MPFFPPIMPVFPPVVPDQVCQTPTPDSQTSRSRQAHPVDSYPASANSLPGGSYQDPTMDSRPTSIPAQSGNSNPDTVPFYTPTPPSTPVRLFSPAPQFTPVHQMRTTQVSTPPATRTFLIQHLPILPSDSPHLCSLYYWLRRLWHIHRLILILYWEIFTSRYLSMKLSLDECLFLLSAVSEIHILMTAISYYLSSGFLVRIWPCDSLNSSPECD